MNTVVDAIYAFHHNPVDPNIGIGVRTIHILKIMQKLLSCDVTLYTLGNDDQQITVDDGIAERHIRSPFSSVGIKPGYLCMFPFFLSRQLRSKLPLPLKERAAIVFETPFMGYALSKSLGLPENALKIYDAHNVEAHYWQPYLTGFLKKHLLLSRVRNAEQHIVNISDYIFVTSEEESVAFQREYSVQKEKLILVPNGVDTTLVRPMTHEEKQIHRDKLGWGHLRYVVFIGSSVKANIEAARWITDDLAAKMPDVCFLIIGSVCNAVYSTKDNVKTLGVLPAEKKNLVLALSDVAINPVISGAGTNVKMLEYLSAGLPIVTTEIGARGLDLTNGQNAVIIDLPNFERQLAEVFDNKSLRDTLAHNARAKAQKFDWHEIEYCIGKKLGLTESSGA